MNHYCTLFDSTYLARGLALYESILHTGEAFTLYIYCFDEVSHKVLKELDLEHAIVIGLEALETEELLAVKPSRSKGEYCWTCTPHVIRHSLDRYHLEQVTYLDADLYFWDKPSVLLKEMKRAEASILITLHRYTPKYDQSDTSGVYCVQFITFKADQRGLEVLQWWQDRCLEWCYARAEHGKFGDQKYLDDWPARFTGVHVLEHLGGGMAPWNVQQYRVFTTGDELCATEVSTGRRFNVIFYHFHGLLFMENGTIDLGLYSIPPEAVELLYKPYVRHLDYIEKRLATLVPSADLRGLRRQEYNWKGPIRIVRRRLRKTYNVYDRQRFVGR